MGFNSAFKGLTTIGTSDVESSWRWRWWYWWWSSSWWWWHRRRGKNTEEEAFVSFLSPYCIFSRGRVVLFLVFRLYGHSCIKHKIGYVTFINKQVKVLTVTEWRSCELRHVRETETVKQEVFHKPPPPTLHTHIHSGAKRTHFFQIIVTFLFST